jgi:hypothetical protein
LTQALATPYLRDSSHPARTCSSVMVGCNNEWSIIFARSLYAILTVIS